MAPHVTHMGVHDHGFNNVSTYGALRRLILEGRFEPDGARARALRAGAEGERRRAGAALDAHRRRRRLRLLVQRPALAVRGHDALAARAGARAPARSRACSTRSDRPRVAARAAGPARAHHRRFAVYYGRGRDVYDVRGRVAHESLFNRVDGTLPLPQRRSRATRPSRTWTRGPGLGAARVSPRSSSSSRPSRTPSSSRSAAARRSTASCSRRRGRSRDHYMTTRRRADGIPYWDTGAPGLARLPGDRRPCRRTRSTTTSRSTLRRGDRRAGPAPARPRARAARRGRGGPVPGPGRA